MNSRINKLVEMEQTRANDPFLKFALAQEYAGVGDRIKAEAMYRVLLDQFADYLPFYYHYGKLLEQLNRNEEAVQMYENGIVLATHQRDEHQLQELKEALFLLQDEE